MDKNNRKKRKPMTTDEYKELCIKKHGDTYILDGVEYVSMRDYVYPTCREHGVFKICAYDFAHIRGCPTCGRLNKNKCENRKKPQKLTFDEFEEKANIIHNYKYKYIKDSFINMKLCMTMICPIHGEFTQPPSSHLRGCGCNKCGIESRTLKQTMTTDDYISKCRIVHNDKYIYTNTIYNGCYEDVEVICPIHGVFKQPAYSHLAGHGCKYCASEENALKLIKERDEFIRDAEIKHKEKNNDYSLVVYKGAKVPVEIICSKGHHYFQTPNKHLSGHGCQYCAKIVSSNEMEIHEFLKSINIEFQSSKRNILSNSKELDIFVPSHNIAIEFDGLFWHSTNKRDKNYHLNKTIECLSKRISLIHIFEDEWNFKRDVIKSMLAESLGVYRETIDAKDCSVREITSSVARDFLNANNIDGYKNSKYKYGLYTNSNELVSVITFDKKGNIISFSNKLRTNVINSLRTLLSNFAEQHTANVIKVSLNRRFCVNKQFIDVGFKHVEYTIPNRFYVDGKNRVKKKPNNGKECFEIYDCGYEIMKMNIA